MAACKDCGAVIWWRRTEAGHWQPMNPDGTVHFPNCRQAVADGRREVEDWYDRLHFEDIALMPENGKT